ncbi:hypothetical protein A3770_11p62450 [Chloropicon primus]|uniref:Uncharacterized protein n=2 Tax=Chloropicon primus TaxID=1764295 RepID=A0A5B8MTQ6_9CHLO|nr:hypothetical protein A3770_11p62450 [Chloropicon primus]|eukprot:QDZ23727.1 hypothetical protein A3770_11p62450 [Chloropicon primus]
MKGFKEYMRDHSRYQNVNARLYLRKKLGQGYDDLYEMKQGKVGRRKAKKVCSDDLTTLGDAWLEQAIEKGCIQPIIGAEHTDWWDSLPAKCKKLVSRDRTGRYVSKGKRGNSYVWGVPYKWGCLCMLVRQDKVDSVEKSGAGFALRDWGDLWHPSLRGKVALPNSPRLLVELTLRVMGKDGIESSNLGTLSKEEFAVFRMKLQELRAQVKTFSTEDALKSMKSQQSESELSNQVYVVVGWSHNLLPFKGKSNKLRAVVPLSGTILSADCWCVPHYAMPSTSMSTIVDKWLSYTTSGIGGSTDGGENGNRSTGLKKGSADIALLAKLEREAYAGKRGGPPADAETGSGLAVLDASNNYTPPCECIERSEFLLPSEVSQVVALRV